MTRLEIQPAVVPTKPRKKMGWSALVRETPRDSAFKKLQELRNTRIPQVRSDEPRKTRDADHAKKGELLRINSFLPSDDQALEEMG